MIDNHEPVAGGHSDDFPELIIHELIKGHEQPSEDEYHPSLHFPVSHAHASLGAGTGQTNQVLGTDIGSKNSSTYYVPGFSFTKKVIFAVGTFLLTLVFLYRAIYSPSNCNNTYSYYYPVEPDKLM